MTKIYEITKFVNSVAVEWLSFIIHPRNVIDKRKNNWNLPVKVYGVIASIISIVALITALYGAKFGSFYSNVRAASLDQDQINLETPRVIKLNTTPELVDWGTQPSISIGIVFPESFKKDIREPQLATFNFGASFFVYQDVIPENIMSGSAPLLFQLLFGLLLSLCLHPFAKLLKGHSSLLNSANYSLLMISYTLGTVFVLALLTALIGIELAALRGPILIVPWTIFVLIPLVVIGCRGYFSGFSELYSLSKKRILLASVGAWVLTSIVSPIIFFPILHIVLVYQPYLDAIL